MLHYYNNNSEHAIVYSMHCQFATKFRTFFSRTIQIHQVTLLHTSTFPFSKLVTNQQLKIICVGEGPQRQTRRVHSDLIDGVQWG